MSIRADAVRMVVFLLVGLLTAGLLYSTVSRARFGVDTTSYSAVFADVSALQPGDLVRVAGVRVGQVTEVALRSDDQVLVTFEVQRSQPVLRSTRALIRYENLVGDRYFELAEGPGSTDPLPAGATIPAARTSPALDLDVLLNGFRPLFQGLEPAQVNQLASDIVATLQGRAGTVESLLAHTASLTGTIADRDQVIGELVDNLNAVLGTLDDRDRQLAATLSELQRLVSGLADDRGRIGDALAQINTFSSDLTGLLTEARPPLRGTIEQLGRTATALDENREAVRQALHDIPAAHARLMRAGSHGAFFNFYLCSVQIKITGPDGEPVHSPVVGSNRNTPRCEG